MNKRIGGIIATKLSVILIGIANCLEAGFRQSVCGI